MQSLKTSMKKLILLSIITLTLIGCSQKKLTKTDKLVATAKIWGFLKYYHPEVGKGKFNWDEQLFQILPKVENAKNKEELSKVYLNWIASLGKVEPCSSCKIKNGITYFDKNFDLGWTQDATIFSKKLSEQLKFIENNRFQGNHHYVESVKGVGNIKVKNEPEYPNFDWKDEKLRVLSLFKYWNTIEYFFPYKYQTDEKWNIVLEQFIPKFLSPETEQEYHLIMRELVVKLDDTHAGLTTKLTKSYFGLKKIPSKFVIIDNKAIFTKFYNDSIAKKNDLEIGDAVIKVNGKSISEILEEKRPYINASNSSVRLRNYHYVIFNGSTDSVNIDFDRNGTLLNKTIKRYPFKQFKYKKTNKEKWNINKDNIGYVHMGALQKEDVPTMMDSLLTTKAIIFDIRNYPNGTMYAISNYLNNEPKEFVIFTEPDVNYPGRYTWAEAYSCGKNNGKEYTGKVILLVNERTQSHAEFTAMCLQTANNVTIIGSQTSGADGNVSELKLVGGFKTWMTGIGVFYPNGKETQRIGIIPNIEVRPTIEGIRNGKDEVLEKAIAFINEQ